MVSAARFALGTVQQNVSQRMVLWGLLDVLEQTGTHVQVFAPQSSLVQWDGATPITGQGYRHLDSWLMSPELCREIFLNGLRSCDLALVEGKFDAAQDYQRDASFDRLCQWLALSCVVTLDATAIQECCLPARPDCVEGFLLDRITNRHQLRRLQTMLETLWNVPLLGYLPELPAQRKTIERLPPGNLPSRELCHSLGGHLAGSLQLDRLLALARYRKFPPTTGRLFQQQTCSLPLRVAVAYDEAFYGYFPDALDLMESRGATVRDFSPLRDEALPDNVDLVYIGSGCPDRFADELAQNHCMRMSLRKFIRGGGRVYAEGGGLAYVCRYLKLADGRAVTMVGALPAVARCVRNPAPPRPVELTLAQTTWMGPTSSRLRGYLNSCWEIEPAGPLLSYAREAGHACDLVGNYQVIGSRLHLNFAVQSQYLDSFFRPNAAATLLALQ